MRLIDADALIEKMKDCGFSTAQELMANAFCFAALKSESLAPTIGGWISVKDRLPKGECVVYSSKFDEMMIGYIGEAQDSDTGYLAENEGEFLYDVTHWMPLPELPKE